ncbi:hypothetical protein D3C73_1174730 [compost metagenome]
MPVLCQLLPPADHIGFISFTGDRPVFRLHKERRHPGQLAAMLHMPKMAPVKKGLPAVRQRMERSDPDAVKAACIPAVLLKRFTEYTGVLQLALHLLYPA